MFKKIAQLIKTIIEEDKRRKLVFADDKPLLSKCCGFGPSGTMYYK